MFILVHSVDFRIVNLSTDEEQREKILMKIKITKFFTLFHPFIKKFIYTELLFIWNRKGLIDNDS
jgi:hypothetical protein